MSHYAASKMIGPWLVDQGYSLNEIATVLSTAGFASGFAGPVTIAASLSGVSAEMFGYTHHFFGCAVLGMVTSAVTW